MKIIELIFYLTSSKYSKKCKIFEYHRIWKFSNNADFRKQDYICLKNCWVSFLFSYLGFSYVHCVRQVTAIYIFGSFNRIPEWCWISRHDATSNGLIGLLFRSWHEYKLNILYSSHRLHDWWLEYQTQFVFQANTWKTNNYSAPE